MEPAVCSDPYSEPKAELVFGNSLCRTSLSGSRGVVLAMCALAFCA